MDWWEPLISFVSVIVGAFVGGIVVHRLTLRRESLAARRAQRVDFLLDAYRKLIDASEREILGPQRRDNLESAFADIMLLGGAEEIKATNRFQHEFVQHKTASLTPVIQALRNSLRNELGIEKVNLPDKFNLRLALDDDELPEKLPEKRTFFSLLKESRFLIRGQPRRL